MANKSAIVHTPRAPGPDRTLTFHVHLGENVTPVNDGADLDEYPAPSVRVPDAYLSLCSEVGAESQRVTPQDSGRVISAFRCAQFFILGLLTISQCLPVPILQSLTYNSPGDLQWRVG